MKKEEIRKEFFKLKNRGFSYTKCKAILHSTYDYQVSTKTLKRWVKRLNALDWDLCDTSRRPKRIHYKINFEIEKEVIGLRNRTGWGQEKLYPYLKHLGISEMSIKRVIKKYKLCKETKTRGKRIKWVRWQRKHPNSLWQIDHTDEQKKGNCYTFSVVDDCSRYSLALVKLNQVTTDVVTHILDELIKKNGKPTTNGKVERLFKTMDEEMEFCNNDLELFRMRYNHFRPHSSLKGKTPGEVYHNFANIF